MIQIPVAPRIPPVLATGAGITASLTNGTLTISFTNLTSQVHAAAIAYFATTIPAANWANFIAQYIGDRSSTDGSYQAAFVTPVAPVGGKLWNLLQTYLLAIQRPAAQVPFDLQNIWAAAPNMPL